MKIKFNIEDVERNGYSAVTYRFYEMVPNSIQINYINLSQRSMDILWDCEFLKNVRSSENLPLIGLFENHAYIKEKGRLVYGHIPMLCGYPIRVNDKLEDLEIEIVENDKKGTYYEDDM